MFDSREIRAIGGTGGALGRLHEARVLQARIRGLKALLEFQQWQIETLSDKLHAETPGGVAAKRLLALKHSKRS